MRHTAAGLGLAGIAGLAALTLGACTIVAGPASSQDREVGDVTALELRTGGDVVLLHGDRPALTITAPEEAFEKLTSETTDGRLTLGSDGGIGVIGTFSYLLETDHVDEVRVLGSGDVTGDAVTGRDLVVSVDGSGDVSLTGIDADRVEVRVSGSGSVELAGTAGEVRFTVSGSGSVSADGLTAERASVTVSGSGDVDLHANEALDARVSGSGSVRYSGDPTVTRSVTGSGDVERD